MPNVSWELNVKVDGGPNMAESDTLAVEAYSEIEITIKKGEKDKKIDLQPEASLKKIKFYLISASKYEKNKLFYTLKPASSNPKKISLDTPQYYIGAGMMSLLDPPPKEIYVTNNLGEDAKLSILIGRDATS